MIKGNHDKKKVLQLRWAGIKDVDYVSINGYAIWLSHYSHRSWRNSFHGSWHLFGHSHGRLEPYGKSLDVGVDCWNFSPVSFDIIKKTIDELPKGYE